VKVLGYRIDFDPEMPRVAEARGIWPFKRIVVGRQWYALPDHERAAVLMHEAAHCRRAHFEKRLVALPLFLLSPSFVKRMAREQEIEADRFAARAGFGAGLIAFLRRFDERESIFYPSHDERVRALEIETARWCAAKF